MSQLTEPPETLDHAIDQLEAAMVRAGGPKPEIRVEHAFTPGLYRRTCHIPAGTLLTSMEHRTAHPFVITRGRVKVVSGTEQAVTYEAPHHGITQPGTRRMLHAETDTTWTTYHVTDETDVEKIGEQILEPNTNPHLLDPGTTGEGWRESNPTNLPDA